MSDMMLFTKDDLMQCSKEELVDIILKYQDHMFEIDKRIGEILKALNKKGE
jgi:hypothetical protein